MDEAKGEPAVKHSRFDSESDNDIELLGSNGEDGECSQSPVQKKRGSPSPVIANADILKGNEVDYGDFFMDRTESNIILDDVEEIDQSASGDAKQSYWMKRTFSGLLNSVEDLSEKKEPEPKRFKPSCFNCGSTDHGIALCPDPKDFKRIREAKEALNNSRTPRVDNGRYHSLDSSTEKFKPGRISSGLREALGIGPDEIPEWIYRMRQMGFVKGYPPGYLKRAIEKAVDDKPLDMHFCDLGGEAVMSSGRKTPQGKDEDRESPPPTINQDKMIYYIGFNRTYRALIDKEPHFRVPPFEAFVDFHRERLTKDHAEDQRESRRLRKIVKPRRHHTRLDEDDGDVIIMEPPKPPVLDDDEIIVLDGRKSPEPDADIPLVDTPKTPGAPSAPLPTPGSSRSVMMGTPVVLRRNEDGEIIPQAETPSLAAFSRGIIPFSPGAVSTGNRGFFKSIVKTIKEVTGRQ